MKAYSNKIAKFLIVFMVIINAGMVQAQTNSTAALNKKIEQLIKKMTLKEKIAMLHGNSLFSSAGVDRLGIPELTCDDGPWVFAKKYSAITGRRLTGQPIQLLFSPTARHWPQPGTRN